MFDSHGAAGDAPLIICCDHSGQRIPQSLGRLGLAPPCLDLHIAHDIGARQAAMLLAEKFEAPVLLANYSRLVIDLNRALNDATLIPEASDGIAIPGNVGLTDAQRQTRIEQFFMPYHRRYGEMVDALQGQFAKPLIVSMHSFAPAIQGIVRPWDFGVLWDEQRELARALAANLRENPGLCIGENQPYHARSPLGYAMPVHAQARGVEMALIEIRQDHIAHRRGQQWAADILHRALTPLLDYAPA